MCSESNINESKQFPFLLQLPAKDYILLIFVYFEQQYFPLSGLAYRNNFPFESNIVMCCSELEEWIAVPLFLVAQSGDGKLL